MENNVSLDETSRDLSLLTSIEQNPDVSQATLADELGVAVGTINWYLKRLIAKGYVKVKRAQRKKLRYIITPEGIALRAALTVDYIRTSFNLYRHTRKKTANAIEEIRINGYTQVNIVGDGEIAEVCRLTCLEAGMPVTTNPTSPKIVIEGIKLALKLPDEEAENPSDSNTINRGNHG
ncbi:MAG TPA: winged helix-turn-helix transcriptional regulator [Anaerolineaceae bacterium]|nr:winged helix-turn-helix transcriptional regulator [Chloroflexota bacterium]HNY83255.1 winged helix-turn-helix transcriptional regulator [Anaerolineaceae bacterium]